ncbi:MAG: DoxX family protein [Gammaproteobacteria bacterium SG8_31]|jgi:putative oxidoreductase|nr:MAG: DoxX family protein [Gammaproteobacteria bacterium SG8_31]
MNFLSKYADVSYAALRIVSGAIFTFHGVQKIFGVLTEHQPPLGSQLWLGGMIELVCGLLIVVGFQTRWAAFLSSGTMAVAYIQFHWKFRLGAEFFPAINGGDAAILYCFVFLYIACRGSGVLALDKSN